jgi:hypothetical protein
MSEGLAREKTKPAFHLPRSGPKDLNGRGKYPLKPSKVDVRSWAP